MTAQWLWHSSAEHVVVGLTPGHSGCIPNQAELQKMLMYRGDTFNPRLSKSIESCTLQHFSCTAGAIAGVLHY